MSNCAGSEQDWDAPSAQDRVNICPAHPRLALIEIRRDADDGCSTVREGGSHGVIIVSRGDGVSMNPWTHLQSIDPTDPGLLPLDRGSFVADDGHTLLDVVYDWERAHHELGFDRDPGTFRERMAHGCLIETSEHCLDASGVWRFRELLPFAAKQTDMVTVGEGKTILQRNDAVARLLGFEPCRMPDGFRCKHPGLFLQYEGLNPSGSFKDNGMAAAFTHARMVGAKRVVCASTGNTSASLALYASAAAVPGYVLVGSGKIALGKLAQALDYGARTLQVAGDFDVCLARVRELSMDRPELGIYLMNSINPFRLEGQKSIMFRVLDALGWQPPDWIVVPGGNLGNCSAFAKAFMELQELGMIDRIPRLAIINASGARTLDRIYNELGIRWNGGRCDNGAIRAEYRRMDDAGERAETVATAIQINRPVNLPKALRALEVMNGVVRSVDDHCILDHKAMVGRYGFGCEPASAASVAGVRILIEEGVIQPDERVVCILTGHALKDPDVTFGYHSVRRHAKDGDIAIPLGCSANRPVPVADDVEAILREMGLRDRAD